MADPFIGEIKMISFNFAPRGWATCNGQLLPINQNQALFSLIGTYYGGNGQTNFALPDFRGRVPVHFGGPYQPGDRGGEASHSLSVAELPQHAHPVQATQGQSVAPVPAGALLATGPEVYAPGPANSSLDPAMIGQTGGSQQHQNMQPFLTINFCSALTGIFPSRQ